MFKIFMTAKRRCFPNFGYSWCTNGQTNSQCVMDFLYWYVK